MKDPNEIVKIEKAIAQKYGEDTIANPKHYWNEDKEKEYVEQIKELNKIELDGLDKKVKANKDARKLIEHEQYLVITNAYLTEEKRKERQKGQKR